MQINNVLKPGVLEKRWIMGLFDLFKSKPSYNSNSKLYKYDTLEHIVSIPVPAEPFKLKCDFTQSVEYVLQRKATEHKRNGNIDLAIACLRKSNEIMPYSPMLYSEKDYLRLVKYLRLAKRFDEARIEEEKILGYTTDVKKEIDSQIMNRAKESATTWGDKPLVIVSREHRLCSECAKYHDRIYSVNGKDSRFPNYDLFEKYINSKTCDCHLPSFPFISGVSIMRGKGEENPIDYSNRPFIDDRTSDEVVAYDNYIQKQLDEQKNRNDYDWICEHLSEIAPKSLSGYMRMKNSNSSNYQTIVEKAKEKNYII